MPHLARSRRRERLREAWSCLGASCGLTTQAGNIEDMIAKGRRSYARALTVAQRAAVVARPESARVLAVEFGVSASTIHRARRIL